MDKTVRLWHVSRTECLCCFKHTDFVTSIQFHPRDDRFFLAGSLDSKLRLWSIPDKSVAFWNQLPDLITAVAFTPDGKTSIAGCLNGMCSFYETEGLKYNTQIHVRSSHGRNAKGSKITGIQTMNFPPGDPNGDVKLLITSNDSRVRLYNLRDKALEMKFRGNENTCSQIHASFSDDARYVICGSEDRKAYIWSTGPVEKDKDKRPVEIFEAHPAIVTTAIMAPTKTRQLLGSAGDPLYDLCNPPPVTLVSRTESLNSSKPSTENGTTQVEGSVPPTPATPNFSKITKPGESPAYIARSAHPNGNIIVTADYLGKIKVFRQDCAHRKRRNDSWETSSTFSKKMLGRSTSVATRTSNRSRRSSLTNVPSSDRIISWRNSVAPNGSLDSLRNNPGHRSVSPRKPYNNNNGSNNNNISPRHGGTPLTTTNTPSISTTSPPASVYNASIEKITPADFASQSQPQPHPHPQSRSQSQQVQNRVQLPPRDSDPLMLQGDHSYMFWNKQVYQSQAASSLSPLPSTNSNKLGVPLGRQGSAISTLSSEDESLDGGNGGEDADREREGDAEGGELRCKRCRGLSFRARVRRGGRQVLECARCGMLAS